MNYTHYYFLNLFNNVYLSIYFFIYNGYLDPQPGSFMNQPVYRTPDFPTFQDLLKDEKVQKMLEHPTTLLLNWTNPNIPTCPHKEDTETWCAQGCNLPYDINFCIFKVINKIINHIQQYK